MSNPTHHDGLVLQAAFRHAQSTGEWVVLVAENSLVGSLLKIMGAQTPRGAHHAGRTLLFDGGGRVTVCSASHTVDGEGFHVVFLERTSPDGQVVEAIHSSTWQTLAKSVLAVDTDGRGLVRL